MASAYSPLISCRATKPEYSGVQLLCLLCIAWKSLVKTERRVKEGKRNQFHAVILHHFIIRLWMSGVLFVSTERVQSLAPSTQSTAPHLCSTLSSVVLIVWLFITQRFLYTFAFCDVRSYFQTCFMYHKWTMSCNVSYADVLYIRYKSRMIMELNRDISLNLWPWLIYYNVFFFFFIMGPFLKLGALFCLYSNNTLEWANFNSLLTVNLQMVHFL